MKKILPVFFLLLLVFLATTLFVPVWAQESITGTGTAIELITSGTIPPTGSIMCTGSQGLAPCNTSYNPSLYGVVSQKAAVVFEVDNADQNYYVVYSGTAKVRVNGQAGPLVVGDLITSSQTPGIGQKATQNGYMLGTALESFTPATPDQEGTILVNLNIHPSTAFTNDRSNLLEILRQGLAAPVLTPLSALRYILAALMVMISFILGFVYFGRLARIGVESIARNPLARKSIHFTVLLHILITIAIFIGGLGIAYLILAL